MIRNRIKEHRRVRAGDLVPHEFNFCTHPEHQRAALTTLYTQVGFARSLLVYELTDGRLKLTDGHLRRDMDPDMDVEVEVLDVTEDEARPLLRSIDPVVVEQYAVLVTCRDEAQQVELLESLQTEGLACRALVSRGGADAHAAVTAAGTCFAFTPGRPGPGRADGSRST